MLMGGLIENSQIRLKFLAKEEQVGDDRRGDVAKRPHLFVRPTDLDARKLVL